MPWLLASTGHHPTFSPPHPIPIKTHIADYSQPLFKVIQQKINGSVQDCINSIANALELLQSCPKPLHDIAYIAPGIQHTSHKGGT